MDASLGLELTIAGLTIHIESRDSEMNFTVPSCHQAFLTVPPASPQPTPHPTNHLCLQVENGPGFQPEAEDLPICITDIWQMWRRVNCDWVFVSPRQNPPRQVIIDDQFFQGKVIGSFGQSSEAFYPLNSIDIRILINWLATFGDIILHASGVAIDGSGYCFIGHSGAGKSTIASALAERQQLTLLGEDQVVLRKLGQRFWIFGTPWHEHPERCSPMGAPLRKIFYLDRNGSETLTELTPAGGVTRILQTAFVPYYLPDKLPLILNQLSELTETVPVFQFKHRLGSDILPSIIN